MGRPLVFGFDKVFFYPLIYKLVPFLSWVHPNIITLIGIYFKYLAIIQLGEGRYDDYNMIILCTYMLGERICDCLDGEIAREYNKETMIGHYLDKIGDNIYWTYMTFWCSFFIYQKFNPGNIYWWVLTLLTGYVPLGLYLDIRNGVKQSLETSKNSWHIYIEDNGCSFPFLLPYLISKI